MGHEPDLTGDALSSALLSFRPTYLYAVPSVFEKIYKNFLRAAQQAGRGSLFERAVSTARDFATAEERQRLGTGSGPGFRPAAPARPLRADGVPQAPRRPGRAGLRRGLRRLTPQPRTRPLLRGYRHPRQRRLRPHRDQRRYHRAAPWAGRSSGRSGGRCPARRSGSPRTARSSCTAPSVFQGYVNDDAGTRAALRGGWLATGDLGQLDSGGLSDDHRAQEGHHHHQQRQERRPCRPGAPAAYASAGPPGGDRGRQPAVCGRPDHPRPGVPGALARLAGPAGGHAAPPGARGERPAGGDRTGRRRRQQHGVALRVDPGVPGPRGALRPQQRPADPLDEAAPGRDRAALRLRDRRDVPGQEALPPAEPRRRTNSRTGTTRTTCSAEPTARTPVDGTAEGRAE